MTEPIKIMMTEEEANIVQTIFDSEQNPHFTITSCKPLINNAVEVELFAESTFEIWYLAKKVSLYQSIQNRFDSMNVLLEKIKNISK